MAISFSTYDLPALPLINVENTKSWIIQIIENKGFKAVQVEYIFTSDIYIHEINREFLGHDYPTDVITFDYSTRHKLSGEIVISVPVVKNNSERFGVSFYEEMRRVIIHGVLHLMGYSDYSDERRKIMRREEDEALKLYGELFAN